MTNIQQCKQLLTPISRFALVAFLLPVQPILESAQAVGPSPQPTPSAQVPSKRSTQIKPYETHLQTRVSQYRVKYRPGPGSNVASYEFWENGQKYTATVSSLPQPEKGKRQSVTVSIQNVAGDVVDEVLLVDEDVQRVRGKRYITGHAVNYKHSEEILKFFFEKKGINVKEQRENLGVKGHSEREPCNQPGHNCRGDRVTGGFQDGNFTHDANYTSPEEKAASRKLRELIERGYKAADFLDIFSRLKEGIARAKEDLAREATPPSKLTPEATLFREPGTSGGADSPTGALPKLLSGSGASGATKSAPGGIDFSTLELRYFAEDSGPFAGRGLRYAFTAAPAAGNKNLNAGRTAAVQASDAFFVWLALSPDKFWVNLNPNEPNRIIDPQFASTDAGRILLQADFQMKKTVARLIHPDTSLGQQYWQQLDKKGCPTFRQWIVPAPATIREDDDGIYITDAPLNVKLESQYFRVSEGIFASCPTSSQSTQAHNESVYRKLILPRIEQAVNKAPEYAALRRVYRSRVAAEWYRQRSASQATTYRDLVNHGDISSWNARQDWSPRQVFNQYVNSIKNGEFRVHRKHEWREGNFIYTQTHTYIFGGVNFTKVLFKKLNSTDFQEKWGNLPQVVNTSMTAPVADHHGKIWLGGSTTPSSKSIWESIWFYLVPGTLVVLFLIRRTD